MLLGGGEGGGRVPGTGLGLGQRKDLSVVGLKRKQRDKGCNKGPRARAKARKGNEEARLNTQEIQLKHRLDMNGEGHVP